MLNPVIGFVLAKMLKIFKIFMSKSDVFIKKQEEYLRIYLLNEVVSFESLFERKKLSN